MGQFNFEGLLPIQNEAQLASANFMAEGLLDYRYPLRDGKDIPLSEVVNRAITDESPCLPEGAVRSEDDYVEATIRLGHLMLLRENGETKKLISGELPTIYLGDYPIKAMAHEHPRNARCDDTIEGYSWYRIHEVDTSTLQQKRDGETAAALILQPWYQPWLPGGATYPVIYTRGNVTPEDQRAVATHLMRELGDR